MPTTEARIRKNGFQSPLHTLQLTSWVVVGLDALLFAVIGIPLVESNLLKLLSSAIFGLSVLILVLCAYQATTCDPADPHIRRGDNGVQVNKDDDESLPYCVSCDSPVFARSKHCRACNKCVRDFDHHCMWFNNCVGASNYRMFAACIGAVAVMTFNILCVCLYLLVEYFAHEEEFELRWHDHLFFENVTKEVALVPLFFLALVNLPFFFLDMQLVLLHMFLSWQNVTTYEYIMNKRTAAEEREYNQANGIESQKGSIRTLPRCLDWIVFKSRRRSKSNGQSQQKKEIAEQVTESIPSPRECASPDISDAHETCSPPADLESRDPPDVDPAVPPSAGAEAETIGRGDGDHQPPVQNGTAHDSRGNPNPRSV